MKLLELISSRDIEEFNLHKWSFMFEYFGTELTMVDNKILNSQILKQGSYENMPLFDNESKNEELIGFHVNPFLMAQMPSNTRVQFKLNNPMEVKIYSSKDSLKIRK